jgi:hypothetical protein
MWHDSARCRCAYMPSRKWHLEVMAEPHSIWSRCNCLRPRHTLAHAGTRCGSVVRLMGAPSIKAIVADGVITADLSRHVSMVPPDMLQRETYIAPVTQVGDVMFPVAVPPPFSRIHNMTSRHPCSIVVTVPRAPTARWRLEVIGIPIGRCTPVAECVAPLPRVHTCIAADTCKGTRC